MAFNNSQNNSREGTNVNTKGLSFFNSVGFEKSALLVGYWNSLISIKMHPALDPSKQTETKKFNYDQVISTALTIEKAFILATKIEKDILPAIINNEQKSVAVPVGADSLLLVSTGKDLTGAIAPYLAIHKSLNQKTKLPELSMYYFFNTDMCIEDYDEKTGTFEIGLSLNAELMTFLNLLKTSIIGLSNVTAHASRCVDKYFKDKLNSDIGEIATKLGVPTAGGNYYQKRKDIFSSGESWENKSTTEQQPATERLDNIEDIENFLD